jgi:hypothetical protein
MSPNYDVLDYLHDALLVIASFCVGDDGLKRFLLRVECHEDCGYHDWNGRTIEVLFENILVAHGQLLGHTMGEEYVASIHSGMSPSGANTVAQLVDAGVSEPNTMVTVVLQSGSEVSIACESIEAKLLE